MSEDKNNIDNDNNLENNITCTSENMIEDLKKEIGRLNIQVAENFDSFLRAKAEVENIKKRTSKEIDNIIKYSNKNIFLDLLPLLDSLDACLNNTNVSNESDIKIFHDMLLVMLEKYNVTQITAEVGSFFDPLIHEVISVIEHDEFDNKICSIVQSGYKLHDQILRYSKVTIFKKK